LLVLTKMEITGAAEAGARFQEEIGQPALSISAVTGKGLPALIQRITHALDEQETALSVKDGETSPAVP
jgi:50S ribosomal subunit-associated GTPase HflX